MDPIVCYADTGARIRRPAAQVVTGPYRPASGIGRYRPMPPCAGLISAPADTLDEGKKRKRERGAEREQANGGG